MQPFYLIKSTYKGQPFVHETDLDGTTREKLVEQLAQGQFDTGTLDAVLLIDLAAGTSLDVSSEIALELSDHSHRTSDTLAPHAEAFVRDFGFEGYRPAPFVLDLTADHPDRYTIWSRAA